MILMALSSSAARGIFSSKPSATYFLIENVAHYMASKHENDEKTPDVRYLTAGTFSPHLSATVLSLVMANFTLLTHTGPDFVLHAHMTSGGGRSVGFTLELGETPEDAARFVIAEIERCHGEIAEHFIETA